LESLSTYQTDGTTRTVKYRVDGKRLHSESVEPRYGTKNITFYRKDGKTLWAKATVETSGDSRVEYFDDNGKLSQLRETTSDHKVITVYDDKGVALYRQTWDGYRYSYGSYYNNYRLDKVEEFAADGKTVKRELEFNSWGSLQITTATDFENGKKSRVRDYR